MNIVAEGPPQSPAQGSREIAACAARLVDTAPLVVRCIRTQMRAQLPTLTLTQFRVMAFLYRQRDCSLTELAEHLGVTRSTASGLIDRFVRRRWATRTIDRGNRRRVMLRLTHRGAAQFDIAKHAARRDAARRLAALSSAQVGALRQSLHALTRVFGDRAEVTRP